MPSPKLPTDPASRRKRHPFGSVWLPWARHPPAQACLSDFPSRPDHETSHKSPTRPNTHVDPLIQGTPAPVSFAPDQQLTFSHQHQLHHSANKMSFQDRAQHQISQLDKEVRCTLSLDRARSRHDYVDRRVHVQSSLSFG